MRNSKMLLMLLLRKSIAMYLLAGLIFAFGCEKKKVVKNGDTVKIVFTATLDNGTIVDKATEDNPMEFTIGAQQAIPALDKGINGMKKNEVKRFIAKPEDTFGLRDENKIGELPKTAFPADYEYSIGRVAKIKDNDGKIMKGLIVAIGDDSIKIDLNHPLAGQNITFEVKVIEISNK